MLRSFFHFFLFFFFSIIPFSLSEPVYLNSTFNATDLPERSEYDFIIVGGGTAGCPLAATLSQLFRVLVLERGGRIEEYGSASTQDGFLQTLSHFDYSSSPAEAFMSLDGVPNVRGRVLGGSSAINAGFYSRAGHDFFSSGGPWNMKLVNRSYEWVEKALVFQPQPNGWQMAVRDGLLDAGITPFNGFTVKHVAGTKIGGSTFSPDGRRHSAEYLLNNAKITNLWIGLYASVERILLSSPKTQGGHGRPSARGVVYRDASGRHHYAMTSTRGEVILCAGALGSPQLLLLSGIGPRNYLSSWGIDVVNDLPYVGQFLNDNPRNGITFISPIPAENSLIQVVGITNSGFFIEAALNVLPFYTPPLPVFVHWPASSPPVNLTIATLMEKIVGPISAGGLWLASTNVRDSPVVRFNYFTSPADLDRCVQGMRRIGEVLHSPAMNEFKFQEISGRRAFRYMGHAMPRNESNDAQMQEFCRRTVSTIWHYHGGCVVGKVVDSQYRVIGVDSLRVVDGSTFAISPGTNPQATVMMLGRYVGRELIMWRRREDESGKLQRLQASNMNERLV